MIRLVLNPKYEHLRADIEQLARPFRFARTGEPLHDGRNSVRRFECGGLSLAVKRYGRISLLNRIVYGLLRRSKAERAYLHAGKMRSLGIDTPEEVAFLEERRRGVLRASYFVSLYSSHRPVMELIARTAPETAERSCLLDRLTDFIYRIHRAGILHRDLNIGNILCKEGPQGEYTFQLIDTNRMEFRHSLSMRQRMHNLRRLSCPVAVFLHMLDRYARIARTESCSVQLKGVWCRLLFENRKRLKSRFRALL